MFLMINILLFFIYFLDAATSDNLREPRFYGLGGSQASAFASANAMGGGYPYGGGLGMASATAVAQANGGGM